MSPLSILKFRASLSVAVLSLAYLFPSSSHAQNADVRAKVNVPFGFEVGATHFEPGTYTISMQSNHIMQIRGASKSVFAMTLWDTTTNPSKYGKVVFHKCNDRYFMREVWTVWDSSHLQFPQSKAELQAQRAQVATNRKSADNVELAVLQSVK
jgi:hypothetical protein